MEMNLDFAYHQRWRALLPLTVEIPTPRTGDPAPQTSNPMSSQ